MDDAHDTPPHVSGTGPAESAYAPAVQPDPRVLSSARQRGYFVTFEGMDGSGKSTQVRRLGERLLLEGEPAILTREPGGSSLGRRLRDVLLRDGAAPLEPLAELFLYLADRTQHLREVVEPALAAGTHVVCDRFLDATLAYQGYARGVDLELIRRLHERPPLDRRPDRTILLDVDPARGLERARARNEAAGASAAEGRFEREALAFHQRVREGYLRLADLEPFRFRIVDAEAEIDEVARRVADLLADLFPCLDPDDAT